MGFGKSHERKAHPRQPIKNNQDPNPETPVQNPWAPDGKDFSHILPGTSLKDAKAGSLKM